MPDARLRVFLCHSWDDKPQVRDLYQSLRNDGFQPWLDEEDLLVGQDWRHEIAKAVRASHVVIVCLSRNSVSKSGFVQKEILSALEVAEEQPEGKIFILPVRLEPCEIPQRLHTRHCANLFEKGGYTRLLKTLTVCASERGLLTPARESGNAARHDSPAKERYAKTRPRRTEKVAVRPGLSPKPVRTHVEGSRGNNKAGFRKLPLLAVVVLVAAIAIIIVLVTIDGRSEKAVEPRADNSNVQSIIPSETVRPGPVLRPELPTDKTPEQPTATPTPAEPQAEVEPVEDENDAPPVSPDGTLPRIPKPPSILSRYTIHIFRTDHSQRERALAKEIGDYLNQYAGTVRLREDKLFDEVSGRHVKKCEILYFHARTGDARNEDAVADVLKKRLNSVYSNASFTGRKVAKVTPNLISLVIGTDCKK